MNNTFKSLFFNKRNYLTLLSSGLISFGVFKLYYNNFLQNKTLSCRDKDGLKTLSKTIKCYDALDTSDFDKKYPNLTTVKSNAFKNLLDHIRDKTIPTSEFRKVSKRLIRILIEEALSLEYDEEVIKESPCGYYKSLACKYHADEFIAVSILRSGDAILDELLNILPDVKIGKILVQRNEESNEKEAIYFFEKLPQNCSESKVILVDPMIATGGSAIASIEILLKKGMKEENILFVNIISCEEGIKNLFSKYPKVKMITGVIDPELLSIKYIAPGLGDFGDRYYGTN